MKVFREMKIKGSESVLMNVLAAIEKMLDRGWTRDYDRENKIDTIVLTPMYCFSCTESPGREAAALWLAWRGSDTLYIANIIPQKLDRLSFDQYNVIAEEFYARFVKPAAERLRLEHVITPAEKGIEDWVSANTALKLETFSRLANKQTGSSHPLDEERWFDFLVAAHAEATTLDSATLARWLAENEGWPEDVAYDLSIEYEFARSLLAFYDERRL
jgi:hypothetical protein